MEKFKSPENSAISKKNKMQSLNELQDKLVEATKSEESWAAFKEELENNSQKDVVKIDFQVNYNPISHGIEIQAWVETVDPTIYLLQIWLEDIDLRIWFPEAHPWNLSGVEFQPENKVTSALCGLIDHKWRKDNSGDKYEALLWGYAEQNGAVVQFGPFVQKFEYPIIGVNSDNGVRQR